jgi:excinuclease ABC subunit C
MHVDAVRERADELPDEPGVYQFYAGATPAEGGGDDRVLYVGKALSLRDRVRSYADPRSERIRRMVDRAGRIEVAVTDTETQALLLEANLIKRHAPRYNVRLKDDKSYPLIQLTDHPVPRIELTRDPDEAATVFGPFTDVGRVETVIKAVRETFGLRGCSDHKYEGRERPCLDYEMGLCTAPCTGEIDQAAYRADVERAVRFLEGETGVLADPLRREMEAAAGDREFERAANLRDRLAVVESFHGGGEEAVASTAEADERTADVIGVAVEGDAATVARLHAERGQLVDRSRHRLDVPDADADPGPDLATERRAATAERAGREANGTADVDANANVDADASAPDPVAADGAGATSDDGSATTAGPGGVDRTAAVLNAFLVQYYAERPFPDALVLSERPTDEEVLAWLRTEGVAVRVPGAGREAKLVELALKNARRSEGRTDEAGALADALAGDRSVSLSAPRRIEGFDVSHAQGTAAVGSNVLFVEGSADKSGYRRKKLPERNDDYANMHALVTWRAERAREGRDDRPDPDLLLIDGGSGQLEAARDALAETGWDVPAVALAKDEELVITADRTYDWPADAPHLHLLQRVRDEAHRFAVQYHQTLRDDVSTVLEDVPGVGPETRKRLLRRFGSVENVREASRADLLNVPGVGERTADAIRRRL